LPRTDYGRIDAPGLVIEEAQIVMHEAHEPDVLAHFFDPDVLTGEHGA
jgi:hypothetical protein